MKKPEVPVQKLLFAVADVAAITSQGETAVRADINNGALVATRKGRRVLVTKASLESYIEKIAIGELASAAE